MKTSNTFSGLKKLNHFFHLSSFSISACLSFTLLSMTPAAFAVEYKAASGSTATNTAFTSLPPLSASQPVKPNVIISFDNSASMLVPAYDDPDFNWKKSAGTHDDFNSSTTYYGYFEDEKYTYDTTNEWFVKSAAGDWDGNFLNWMTMRRVDIARKVLIGGKVRRKESTAGDTYTSVRTEVSSGGSDYWVLEAQADTTDSDSDTFVKVEDASDSSSSSYTPYDENNKYWVKQGTIKVDENNDGDWDDTDDESYNVHIALKDTAEPIGFLQENKDEFRIGSAVFNYDHTRPINGTNSGIYRQNTTVDGGTLYPCFPDWKDGTPTNYDVCLPTHVKAPLDNIVRVIEEYPLVWGTTAIAETMYTIYGYASQTDHGITHNTGTPQTPAGPYFFPNGQNKTTGKPSYEVSNAWDPYYYSTPASTVHCCKVYVININDGGSYNDWDDAATKMPSALVTGIFGTDEDGDSNPSGTSDGRNGRTEFVDDLALYLRKTDIRDNANGIGIDDLEGHQEIVNYYIFAALGGASASDIRKMKESAANGAFVDFDGDHLPDVAHGNFSATPPCAVNEWDLDSDCDPDGFFNADTGAALVTALRKTFNSIRKQVSSGTSAAVLANSTDGVGTIYHSLYQPTSKDINDKVIRWGGILNALFIDKNGYIREDNPSDGTLGVLDNFSQDRIISIYYDEVQQQTLIQRYNGVDMAGNKIEEGGPVPLKNLNSIWEARDALSNVTYNDANRSWSSPAQSGRYIVTSINNTIVPFEQTKFETADVTSVTIGGNTFSLPLYRAFGLTAATETLAAATDAAAVEKVIQYVRGKENISGFRNRTMIFGKNSVAKPWLLGDIIHSTPAVVAAPDKSYDLLYGDSTYLAFKNKYANRRQMVYVGANDGMLHAFNGGFFNSITQRYTDTPTGLTDHNLGTEMWAYVPQNLLPHLQWLISPNYQHVFYVDGAPFIFDARIWDTSNLDTDVHPKGWGTLMAVTLRLGGAPFKVDLENDGVTETGGNADSDSSDDVTFTSAIAIFDITDPESSPVLLKEFIPSGIGFTTSKPNLIIQHLADTTSYTFDSPSKNKWYLTFGSGPNDLDTVTRNDGTIAKLFIMDLDDIENGNYTYPIPTKTTGLVDHFLGDTQVVDWVRDYNYDTLYVGTVGGTVLVPEGQIRRLDLGTTDATQPAPISAWGSITPVMNFPIGSLYGQPFANRPIEAYDILGNPWLYVGTGRLLTSNDTKSEEPQSFYGIKEVMGTDGLPIYDPAEISELQDVSGVRVFVDNSILDPKNVIPGTQPDLVFSATVDTFFELESDIELNKRGWVINFEPTPSVAGVASTRNTSAATLFSQLTIFSSFTPSSDDICTALGNSSLHVVYGRTGTAYPDVGLGNKPCTGTCPPGSPEETVSSIEVGAGQAAETIVHIDTAITNLGTGAISAKKLKGVPVKTGRSSWQELEELPAIAK